MPRKNHPINPFDEDAADRIANSRRKKHRRDEAPRLTRRPELTSDVATQFVKILRAGVPAREAIAFFAPEHYATLDDAKIERWTTEWTTANLTVRALNILNGGTWEDLEPDARLELALDQALASLAYFLVTHDYSSCGGLDLKKHDAARRDLMEYLKGSTTGDADTPWMRALTAIVEGTSKGAMPPQLAAVPVPPKGN